MTRNTGRFSLFVLLVVSSTLASSLFVGCSSSSSDNDVFSGLKKYKQVDPSWRETYEFSIDAGSRKDGFVIEFPSKPEVKQLQADAGGDELTTANSYQVVIDESAYRVMVYEIPPEIYDEKLVKDNKQIALEGEIDSFIDSVKGDVLTYDSNCTTEGYPSAYSTFTFKLSGIEYLCYVRVILVENMVYDIITMGVSEDEATEFADSFSLNTLG